jgi:hypothetical protein
LQRVSTVKSRTSKVIVTVWLALLLAAGYASSVLAEGSDSDKPTSDDDPEGSGVESASQCPGDVDGDPDDYDSSMAYEGIDAWIVQLALDLARVGVWRIAS